MTAFAKYATTVAFIVAGGLSRAESRGDLIIRLEAALPHKLSAAARRAVEELKEEGL